MSFLSTREWPRATGYLHRQEPGYTYGIQVALTLARACRFGRLSSTVYQIYDEIRCLYF